MTEPKPLEIAVPLSQTEIWKADGTGRQEVWVRPLMPVVVDEVFVDGDMHLLKRPLVLQTGQLGRFEVPPKYKKDSICGVYAAYIGEKGEEVSRCPLGGQMWGEFEPCPVELPPREAKCAVFQPESQNPRVVAVRFKRFDIEATVDLKAEPAADGLSSGTGVVITDIQIGKNSQCFSRNPIPIEMAMREKAFLMPDIITRGTTFTVFIANLGRYPVRLTGSIIFEEALGVKYVVPQNLMTRN